MQILAKVHLGERYGLIQGITMLLFHWETLIERVGPGTCVSERV